MFRGHLSPTSERKFGSSGRGGRIIEPEVGRERFNCGKTGHLAKDCRAAPTCVRCGKVDHTSRNCELTPRCFNCGKVGYSTGKKTVFIPRD